MKLITKFLTTLTPIAIVGSVTPTIVSCGCSGKEYVIEYGSDINCKNKKDKDTYKKLAKVQEAITKKIQVETEEGKQVSVSGLNTALTIATDTRHVQILQNVYYEFVYYYAYLNKDGFTLSKWVDNNGASNWTFNFDGKDCNVKFEYKLDGEHILLHVGDLVEFRSHTYEVCKGVN